ncbi:hypothetical protein FB446DRAFT_732636 [Lentinula raphanica]|nr:hypothetical protein FB446DRAFT_732636 [Lentinula raphanica]
MRFSFTSILFSIIISASLATVDLIMARPTTAIKYKSEPHELVDIPFAAEWKGDTRSASLVVQFETPSTALAESTSLSLSNSVRRNGATSIHSFPAEQAFPRNCVLHVVGPKLSKPKLISNPPPFESGRGWKMSWDKRAPYDQVKAICFRQVQ